MTADQRWRLAKAGFRIQQHSVMCVDHQCSCRHVFIGKQLSDVWVSIIRRGGGLQLVGVVRRDKSFLLEEPWPAKRASPHSWASIDTSLQ